MRRASHTTTTSYRKPKMKSVRKVGIVLYWASASGSRTYEARLTWKRPKMYLRRVSSCFRVYPAPGVR